MNNRYRLLILVLLVTGASPSCTYSSTQRPNPAGSSNPAVSPNPTEEIELLTASPNQAFSGEETGIILTGSGFDKNLKIKIGADEIIGYRLIDSKTLQLKINPSGSGLLDIILTTSDGKEITLKEGLLIYHSRPAWHLEPFPLKKPSDPIAQLIFGKTKHDFLVAVTNQEGDILSLDEYLPPVLGNIGPFWGKEGCYDPSCIFTGDCTGNEGGGCYAPNLRTITIYGPTGEYFAVINYRNLDTGAASSIPLEGHRVQPIDVGFPGFRLTQSLPLPGLESTPTFFSDIGQTKVYALSVVSDTKDAPNSVNLWQWDGTSSWISLLFIKEPGDQLGSLIQNPAFIANTDPTDSFVCLVYEEQGASCSRAGDDWKKISFSEITAGKKIASFAYDAKNRILFAGEDSGKVLVSRDFATWTLWGDGSLGDGSPNELLFNAEKEILLAATTKGEIYSSFRGGKWILITVGKENPLFIRNLSHLIYDPMAKRFYAVLVYGGGPLDTPDSSDPFPWYSIGSFSLSE